MLKLSIMSEEELTHIFGDLDSYIPLHEDLLASLGEATKPDGTVEQIGPILVKWLPRLHAYKGYCSNQLAAKALLDQKKQDRRVQDFLQRCLESPFSRKLDLWSFLDIPRSRLVKYPLLLKEILRHTPKEHPDIHILQEAISIIQGVLSDINVKKGESECQYYIDKLEYLDEKQKDPRIEGSKALLCHGELKNKNGHKLYVFLFQEMLVLTRPVTRNERQAFQVYRQPIPVQELLLEDLQDGDVKMGGSFRGAFANHWDTAPFHSSSGALLPKRCTNMKEKIFIKKHLQQGGVFGISNLPMQSLDFRIRREVAESSYAKKRIEGMNNKVLCAGNLP
uniref:DH domain-containing protein n=1 Tax=Zonotrichia albicollis TaxID=44394 RepID=A0A8D2LY20_ZONAL